MPAARRPPVRKKLTPNTLTLILAHLTKFLTVAIHHILAHRHVYPPSSFVSARAYNLPVRQNRHPGVCEWINSAVEAVRAQLAKGAVQHVVLAIHHAESAELLERFVFDVSRLPPVPRGELDTPIVRASEGSALAAARAELDPDPRAPGGQREHELADLLEQFRAALSAISVCGARLKQIPRGCTFTLAVELKDEASAPIGHPQPWIPVEPESQRNAGKPFEFGVDGDEIETELEDDAAAADGDGLYDPPSVDLGQDSRGKRKAKAGTSREDERRTVPLRSIDAGEMVMELWVEEGTAKNDLTAADFKETPPASFERLG